MSDNKVIRSILCNGPGVLWSTLEPTQRLMWLFFQSGGFTPCGNQLVEIDTSDPDDIWPSRCPVCQTDINLDYDDTVANLTMIG